MMPLAARRRKIKLYGHLADALGQDEFLFAANSPAAAVRLLTANFPDKFPDAMKHGNYHVVVGEPEHGIYCNDNLLDFRFPEGTIHFMPEVSGSGMGKGMIMALVGVSILAIALTGGAAAGGLFAGGGLGATSVGGAALSGGLSAGLGTSIFGGVTWSTVALAGTAIALAGISILLTPSTATPASGSTNSSFIFNGAQNTTKEGVCVPLLYGRCIAGSVVVSVGLFNEALDPVTLAVLDAPISDGIGAANPLPFGTQIVGAIGGIFIGTKAGAP